MTKALVLFSGGLDSRLVVKILQEQNMEVVPVMFKLPFGGGCCNDEMCSFKFSQIQGVPLKIVDCTKGKLFKEYIKILRNPKYGTGAGVNPCIDCRIFILKHAKPLLKKLNCQFIATGEVLGERPMSQYRKAMDTIEEAVKLKGKILRPLSAKHLPETQAEKKGLVNRSKLLDIQGRNRKPQIALAKKYKIDYPHPAGGCILCEKDFKGKLNDLLKHEKTLKPEHVDSLRGFRHFRNRGKIILGRNHAENLILEKLNKKLKYYILVPEKAGPTCLYQEFKDRKLVKELVEAYSSKNLSLREKFDKIKI